MTRRIFLRKMLEKTLAVMAGSLILVKDSVRRFTRAKVSKNYPGRIETPTNIDTIGRWSG